MILSLISTIVNFTRMYKRGILGITIYVTCVVAMTTNNTQLYKHVDCLVGGTVLNVLETRSRKQCAFHCMNQNGGGFSYTSETRECKIFKQVFIDKSRCGMSSNIYGKLDGCASPPTLMNYAGNYIIQHPFMGDRSLARYKCTEFNDPGPVEHCPISKCEQFWTPATLSCSERDLMESNYRYNGKVTCTVNGITCQRWDSNTPHDNHYLTDRSDLHNWCQTYTKSKPWCFTTDPDVNWAYCQVEDRLDCNISPPSTLPETAVRLEIPYLYKASVGRYRCNTLVNTEIVASCPVTRCLVDGSWSAASVTCSNKECYDQKNGVYNGLVTCTETGIPCQRWDSNTPHSHDLHFGNIYPENRCVSENGGKPWCYTADPSVRWDFCPVDPCV